MSVAPDNASPSGESSFCSMTSKSWTVILRLALLLVASGWLLWKLAEMWGGYAILLPAVSVALIALTGLYFFAGRGKSRPSWLTVLGWAAPCGALALVLCVWTLSFASTKEFGLSSRSNQPAQILLGGLAMSVLLFDIALLLSSTRSSARAMADLMTRRVRESETRVRAVIDHAPDGIITFDKQGVIETFNPGAAAVFRYTATEVKGLNIQKLMPGCIGLLSDSAVSGHNSATPKSQPSEADKSPDSRHEVLGRRKDGVSLPVELTISRMDLDDRYTFMAIVRDISVRKRAQDRLVHDALHDSLTSLPNRAYFMSRLESAVNNETRCKGRTVALLFLDVDRFKLVNDSLGHIVGDQFLVGIAQRLKSLVRPGDTIARLGGDEFAILLQSLTTESEAAQIAERIQTELAVPFALGDEEVYATASIGIAFSSGRSEKPADLLRDADTAMYRAKAMGRARFETFHEGMHTRIT